MFKKYVTDMITRDELDYGRKFYLELDVVKCGMPGCNNYIPEDEAKFVEYNGKCIPICESCDDDNFKFVDAGDKHVKQNNKVEKIKKHSKLW